jgi:hypothetical protein
MENVGFVVKQTPPPPPLNFPGGSWKAAKIRIEHLPNKYPERHRCAVPVGEDGAGAGADGGVRATEC